MQGYRQGNKTVSNLVGIDIHTMIAEKCYALMNSQVLHQHYRLFRIDLGGKWRNHNKWTGNNMVSRWYGNQPSVWPTTEHECKLPEHLCNTATINVPVLYPNSNTSRRRFVWDLRRVILTCFTGTFYKWTLSGGGNIIGPDSNIAVINIIGPGR